MSAQLRFNLDRTHKSLTSVQQGASPPLVITVRRYHQRGTTLLAETVTAIAKNIWLYSVPELSALPPDLAQLVFDELLMLGKLTRSSLALFSSQHLYKLRLEDYPGVGNDWLKLLTNSPLLVINLSRCIQVGSLPCQQGETHLAGDYSESNSLQIELTVQRQDMIRRGWDTWNSWRSKSQTMPHAYLCEIPVSYRSQTAKANVLQIGDASLAALAGQIYLEQLILDGCRRITDEGLQHLSGKEYL